MKRSLRIALCQINTIPGDIPGNVARIREVAGTVASLGADLAVFPEMAIVGYSPRDLLFRRRFVEAAEAALRELAAEAGLTLPEAYRGLSQLLEQRLLKLEDGWLEVPDPSALSASLTAAR